MKKDTPAAVVHASFKDLRKLVDEIKEKPTEDAVHDFRVKIKKLRAFLRMLQVSGEDRSLKIPGRVKKLYDRLGSIRDLQICHDKVSALNEAEADTIRHFRKELEKKLKNNEEENKTYVSRKYWESREEEITNALPEELDEQMIYDFFNSKLISVNKIVESGVFEDEDLHTIRKQLKDMIHINSFLEEYFNGLFPMPVFSEDQKMILEVTASVLGQFVDMIRSLALLNLFRNKIAHEERVDFDSLYLKWMEEKLAYKQEAIAIITESFATHARPAVRVNFII
jgi:CHAD domain-containing protein